MKDYSYSFDIPSKHKGNSEEYFLFYEKKEGKLIVHLTSGNVKEFTYSKDVEQMILQRMEMQVKKYENFFIKLSENDCEELIKKTCPFVVISSVSSFAMVDASSFFSVLNYIVLGAGSIVISYGGIGYYYSKYLKKDYDKHKLFLDNKELIQKGTRRDLRPLNGINKKALKEAMKNIADDMDSININTIRLLSQEEIELIINNVREKNTVLELRSKKK